MDEHVYMCMFMKMEENNPVHLFITITSTEKYAYFLFKWFHSIDFGYNRHLMLFFKFLRKLSNIWSKSAIVYGLWMLFYLQKRKKKEKNTNKLVRKCKLYPKSIRIDAFERNIWDA